MDWFTMAYTVLGGLGIFFFGMKMLSDGLQAISSGFIRKAISSVTDNRFMAVIIGILVTLLVQSSSISSVMTVGFVNAGLMTLKQAIGVIFGANIGTTITGWIIAIRIGQYSLVLIGLAIFPLLLSRNERVSSWAKVVLALGFIFLGLQFMSDAFRPLRHDQGFLDFITLFSANGYLSLWAAIAMGCFVTLIVQSSSATLAITIALASTGSITYQTGVAFILGENIGTTITALLAGATGNASARRAALAHAIFNICSVILVSLIFWTYLDIVNGLIFGDPDSVNELGDKPFIATHIAAAHTIFNVTNVIIFLPLMGLLAKAVEYLVPEPTLKEPKHLEFLGTAATISAPLAIAQARKELEKVMGMVGQMIDWSHVYMISEPCDDNLRKRILKYETITDNIHQEMMLFCGLTMTSNLTKAESNDIKATLKISDELESIADYCQKLTRHRTRMLESQIIFDGDTSADLEAFFNLTKDFYQSVVAAYIENTKLDVSYLRQQREKAFYSANKCRDAYLDRVANEKLAPMASLTLADIVFDISRIFSHTRNIAESHLGIASSMID